MTNPGHLDPTAGLHAAGTITIGGDMTVHRLGFGAMRLTGPGVWGQPSNRAAAIAVLRRAVELGVDFIDTADAYGPYDNEELIAEALHPYPRRTGHRHQSGTAAHRPQPVALFWSRRLSAPAGRNVASSTSCGSHRPMAIASHRPRHSRD